MKALVVDDSAGNRMILGKLLQKQFGMSILQAQNGLDAIELLSKEKIDIVLLDVEMPIMDGIECLRSIRSEPALKDIPVIMVTAHNAKDLVKDLISLHISGYILKPIDIEDVVLRIGEILKKLPTSASHESTSSLLDHAPSVVKKIIVAEHDSAVRDWIVNLIEAQYECIEAKNGAECLRSALNSKPQAVIMGNKLPLMNEFILARKIHEEVSPNIKRILFATAEANISEEQRSNFDCILRRGMDASTFLNKIKEVFEMQK